MNIYHELKARGFIYQETDSQAIENALNVLRVTFYVGFDPTGNSLHVGHLLPVMAMRLLQKAGHIPVVLVGGATAQIGDPSGRSTARNMLTKETVAENAKCLKNQLAKFISMENGLAHFVNNNDWFKDLYLLDFLRDIGSRFSVNRMLAQESVKQRLENGLSFLEFSYSLLQGYDFYYLFKTLGCTMELGGQDQWGNMVAGTELIRRMSGEKIQVYCLTIPLLMNPATGQKFGKSIGGASVWLDPERTSVFDYYQFWRNCDDGMILDLLKKFALDIPVEEAEALVASGNINRAKEILAYEATKLAHGKEEAAKAYIQAGLKFGFADPENKIPTTSEAARLSAAKTEVELPTAEIAAALFEGEGLGIAKLIVEAGLAKSTSEARRLVQGNAVSIDDKKITDVNKRFLAGDLPGKFILKTGKKNFKQIVVKS
ncbi:MAG: tyrosine--tRNA ligase [Lentisphaeria bacterium]|nr:tyrosine--tRNA ligase [Lentisphaeria bacterium]